LSGIIKVSGLILMAFGMLLLTNVIPLATVIYYTPPSLSYPYPGGTASPPTSLPVGTVISIKVTATDAVDPSTQLTCTVQMTTYSGSTYDSGAKFMSVVTSSGVYQYHSYDWTVPNLDGTIIKFHFVVTNTGGVSTTLDTYGSIGDPTGDFYINGNKVTSSSIVKVTSPMLTLKVSLTSLQSYVTGVEVDIVQGSAILKTFKSSSGDFSVSGNDYSASYTLPSGGTYTISALIYTSAKPQGISLAMLGLELDSVISTEGGGLLGLILSRLNALSGIGFIAIGAVLFTQFGKPKKRKKVMASSWLSYPFQNPRIKSTMNVAAEYGSTSIQPLPVWMILGRNFIA